MGSMNKSLYGIDKNDLDQMIQIIAKNPKIESITLFGSRAKGNHSIGSDIDLSLQGKHLNSVDIINASIETDELFLPYKIDFVIFEHINEPKLVEHITRVGIVLYRNSDADPIQ